MAIESTRELLLTVHDRLADKLFVYAREAAEILGMDERTVRRAIERGEIPAVKIGSVTRIPVTWLRQVARLDEPAND